MKFSLFFKFLSGWFVTALFLIGIGVYDNTSNASEIKSVYCEYNYENSSIVTSLKQDKDVTTYLSIDDKEATLFIKDVNNLSEINDYIILKKNDKSITFALKCKKI